MVFFEMLNEPEVGRYRWAGIQQSLVRSIRRAAPEHTIIVTCGEYSNPDDLVRMPQVADNNYIVNFHYYTPHIFTHQGASWGEAYWVSLRQVPFPGTPESGRGRDREADGRLGALEADAVRIGALGRAAYRRRNRLPRGMGERRGTSRSPAMSSACIATTPIPTTACAG